MNAPGALFFFLFFFFFFFLTIRSGVLGVLGVLVSRAVLEVSLLPALVSWCPDVLEGSLLSALVSWCPGVLVSWCPGLFWKVPYCPLGCPGVLVF